MNGFVIAASVAAAAVFGPFFGMGARGGTPPKPFDEKVTLPGKIPPTVKSLSGSWSFGYQLDNAAIEGRDKGELVTGTVLTLREDGTYQLHYFARWNLPRPALGGAVPTIGNVGEMKGRNVDEEGRFSLSGEVLLLEPSSVGYGDVENNALVNRQQLANENHTLLVRLDKAHLSVAGRCASYQVDPICRDTPLIWFPMKAQVGTRWLGREPK
jgi:hypothetical protein